MAKNIDICNAERPVTFDMMVGQSHVVENLRQQAIKGEFFQCYILEGQFGSGKTTIARIIARAANCEDPDEHGNPCGCCAACKAIQAGTTDVVELDAASNTGVDAIREIKESVAFLPTHLKKKIYIIDEAQKLSGSAFDALLKILEEPPEHVLFILCTTELKKIPVTVRSRAARYEFGQISEAEISGHLTEIAVKYGLRYEESAIDLIAKNASGSMRNAIKLLEQAGVSDQGVTEENIIRMLGLTDSNSVVAVIETITDGNIPEMIKRLQCLMRQGANPLTLMGDMISTVVDCILYSVAGSVTGTEHYKSLIHTLCNCSNTSAFCALAKGLKSVYAELQISSDEITLVSGMIALMSSTDGKVTMLETRIAHLEEKMEELYRNPPAAAMGKMEKSMPQETEAMPESGESMEQKVNPFSDEQKDEEIPKDSMKESDEEARECVETNDNEPEELSDPFDLLGIFGYVSEENNSSAGKEVEEKEQATEATNTVENHSGDNVADIVFEDGFTGVIPELTDTESEEQERIRLEEEMLAELYFEEQMSEDREAFLDRMAEDDLAKREAVEDYKTEQTNDDARQTTPPDVLPPNAQGREEDFLPELYRKYPVMESVLELGFYKDNAGWYVTDKEPLFRIAEAYRDVVGFPFGIRKEAAK